MAKLERTLHGNFNQWLEKIEDCILKGSVSISLEDSSDFLSGDARCSIRVFEQYSYAGGNCMNLRATLFQNGDGPIYFSAITAGGRQVDCEYQNADEPAHLSTIIEGGKQAIIYKNNICGEETFLEKLREL